MRSELGKRESTLAPGRLGPWAQPAAPFSFPTGRRRYYSLTTAKSHPLSGRGETHCGLHPHALRSSPGRAGYAAVPDWTRCDGSSGRRVSMPHCAMATWWADLQRAHRIAGAIERLRLE